MASAEASNAFSAALHVRLRPRALFYAFDHRQHGLPPRPRSAIQCCCFLPASRPPACFKRDPAGVETWTAMDQSKKQKKGHRDDYRRDSWLQSTNPVSPCASLDSGAGSFGSRQRVHLLERVEVSPPSASAPSALAHRRSTPPSPVASDWSLWRALLVRLVPDGPHEAVEQKHLPPSVPVE
ncbi:hypothetical protein GW17_00002315 [Ensete ventricosum]|nr:hypothetical protein GW17_00002315 [Ensete ventricosum]